MSDPAQPPKAVAQAWLALCAALVAGSLLAWALPATWLDWQPARAAAQPWRLVTAAWVHWSGLHLAANLVGVAVVAALGRVGRLPAGAAWAWAAAWPLTHAGLWAEPALARYGGASGVLHAAVAVAACFLVAGVDRRARRVGMAIAAGLVAKVLLEEPWAGPVASQRAWDIAVAPAAHASGAVAGAFTAVVALALRRPARRSA